METLGRLIKRLRYDRKMTQQDLADYAAVSVRFIAALEAGQESARMDKVNQVLEVFDMELAPVPKKREVEDA